jgi:hypothetical protein
MQSPHYSASSALEYFWRTPSMAIGRDSNIAVQRNLLAAHYAAV